VKAKQRRKAKRDWTEPELIAQCTAPPCVSAWCEWCGWKVKGNGEVHGNGLCEPWQEVKR
jgi:hypothetical protein